MPNDPVVDNTRLDHLRRVVEGAFQAHANAQDAMSELPSYTTLQSGWLGHPIRAGLPARDREHEIALGAVISRTWRRSDRTRHARCASQNVRTIVFLASPRSCRSGHSHPSSSMAGSKPGPGQTCCVTVGAIRPCAHNPKVAGSNPAPATK